MALEIVVLLDRVVWYSIPSSTSTCSNIVHDGWYCYQFIALMKSVLPSCHPGHCCVLQTLDIGYCRLSDHRHDEHHAFLSWPLVVWITVSWSRHVSIRYTRSVFSPIGPDSLSDSGVGPHMNPCTRFHWFAPLSSYRNWSDCTIESDSWSGRALKLSAFWWVAMETQRWVCTVVPQARTSPPPPNSSLTLTLTGLDSRSGYNEPTPS